MPGPEYAGIVTFYEDFPYAFWNDFRGLESLPPGALDALPTDVSILPTFADITDQLERKIMGIDIYESQIERLFDGTKEMANAVRSYGRALAKLGVEGAANGVGPWPRHSRISGPRRRAARCRVAGVVVKVGARRPRSRVARSVAHRGLRDPDQFVLWVHGIAVDGLPNAYDQTLAFPPAHG
jgi:hypothetical protein